MNYEQKIYCKHQMQKQTQLELILSYPEVLTFETHNPMIQKMWPQLRYLKERSKTGMGINAAARSVNEAIVRS